MSPQRISFLLLFIFLFVLACVGFNAPEGQPTSLTASRVSTIVPMGNRPETEEVRKGQTLADVLELAKEMLQELKTNVGDYQATMVKRERIRGRLGNETSIQLKVRNRDDGRTENPGLSVYLKFLVPASSAGREVIWEENRNGGKLIAHEGGIKNFLRVSLNPTGRLAMLGNKYPITDIGLINLVEKLIEKGERDKHLSSVKVSVDDNQSIDDRPCQLIEVIHPEPEGEVDFHIAQIFVDKERGIPLRYAAYLWPESDGEEPPLEEEYTYFDVKLNVGLSDKDFDPDNPAYNFP